MMKAKTEQGLSVGPNCVASFKLFDENKDGQLSREELEHSLTRTVHDDLVETTDLHSQFTKGTLQILTWLTQKTKRRVAELPEQYKTKINTTIDQIFKTIDTDGVRFSAPLRMNMTCSNQLWFRMALLIATNSSEALPSILKCAPSSSSSKH